MLLSSMAEDYLSVTNEGIFFITFRLAFSLPKVILNELENRKNEINDKLKRLTEKDKRIQETKYNKILFDIEDSFLDKYAEGAAVAQKS